MPPPGRHGSSSRNSSASAASVTVADMRAGGPLAGHLRSACWWAEPRPADPRAVQPRCPSPRATIRSDPRLATARAAGDRGSAPSGRAGGQSCWSASRAAAGGSRRSIGSCSSVRTASPRTTRHSRCRRCRVPWPRPLRLPAGARVIAVLGDVDPATTTSRKRSGRSTY